MLAMIQAVRGAARYARWARVPRANIASSRLAQCDDAEPSSSPGSPVSKTNGASMDRGRPFYIKRDEKLGPALARLRKQLEEHDTVSVEAVGGAMPLAARIALYMERDGYSTTGETRVSLVPKNSNMTAGGGRKIAESSEKLTVLVKRSSQFFVKAKEIELLRLARLEEQIQKAQVQNEAAPQE
ncbi:hypothetical protein FVE85_3233 [Porphyridium purpureum]|uniref:DNA/RNA-binding protein Alba-like domain-containing protein n=1 Tax=Porphyridium purpureum TaxID=35688 RepID=A0A5J4YVV5_PORPP|nr:hypothetical protein FVE85_3233 [Porphyridium purpureum]|eukprot:POR6307..scf227_4